MFHKSGSFWQPKLLCSIKLPLVRTASYSVKDMQRGRDFFSWLHLMLNLDVWSVRFSQPLKKLDSFAGGRFLRSSGNTVLFDGFGSFLSGIVPEARTQLSWMLMQCRDLCALCGVLASVISFDLHRKRVILCPVPSMLSNPKAVDLGSLCMGF